MSYIAYHELNQEHKNKLIKRQSIQRLTTDDPQENIFIMLNYAYRGDDGNVKLRYGNGEENIDLCEYIAQESSGKSCDLSAEAVMDGACIEGCDCPFAILYTVAVQAAELRERLKMYEDSDTEQPSVDSIPVVHGRWDVCKTNGFLYCSECRDVFIDADWLQDGKWNYCPNCGAKMDGGTAEGGDTAG